MSDSPVFTFDTNVLFYAADIAAGPRHHQALLLMDRSIGLNCVLTLQSLAELYNAMAKRRAVPPDKAAEIVDAYRRRFPVATANEEDLSDAIAAHRQHNISFWDAMLWATARRAGCNVILSEDLQDGRTLGGVTIRNPFAKGFRLEAL